MSLGKVIVGVLAGIATGAAIGILIAPKKGAYIRRDIQRKGEDLVDALNDRVEELNDKLKHAFNVKPKHSEAASRTLTAKPEMVN